MINISKKSAFFADSVDIKMSPSSGDNYCATSDDPGS
jgi:hypothetical protein